MKNVLAATVIAVGVLLSTLTAPAVATTQPPGLGALAVKVIAKPNCDVRSPRIEVTLIKSARQIRFGVPEAGADYVLKATSSKPGTYRFTMPRMGYGSSQTWVIVTNYNGEINPTTSKPLVFNRPSAEDCVAEQLHSLTTFKSGVNKRCTTGQVTDYIVKVWVKRGSPGYLYQPGTAELIQKNGVVLVSKKGQLFGKGARIAEYHVFAGRGSRLDIRGASQTVLLLTSSVDVELNSSVTRTCTGAGV